jgi:hypothetical protein
VKCRELAVVDNALDELILMTPRLEGGAGQCDAYRQLREGLCAAVHQLNEFAAAEKGSDAIATRSR